jgi:hypothetical protein
MEQEELLLECVLIFNQIGNCDKSMLLLAVRPQGPLQGVKEQVSLELFQVENRSSIKVRISQKEIVSLIPPKITTKFLLDFCPSL